MSEPKPERITEAELGQLERSSTEASQLRDLHAIDRLVAEVRRLRGLIENGASAIGWIDDFNDESAWDELVAEAEAIRSESANPPLTRQDPQA